MRPLTAREILDVAEQGAAAGPARRALIVLAAAYPDIASETILAAPLSARDRALLAVRAAIFGPRIVAQETCAECGETLELSVTSGDIGLAHPGGEGAGEFPPAPTGRTADGVQLRAVTAGDAAAAEVAGDIDAAREILAARVAPGAAPNAQLDELLEALDPAADVELAMGCPACGATTVRSFDAADFVWREVTSRVPRILRDVSDVARHFHWSERDILEMPATRRAFYLSELRA